MGDLCSLKGKVAIVTGASKGIGRAIALTFAQAGADIVAAARSADKIKETVKMVESTGRKAIAVPTDVTNIDQIENLLKQTLSKFGKVDILVNNAGGMTAHDIESVQKGSSGLIIDYTPELWREGFELNMHSVFYCCKIIGASMVKQKSGSIVNIASGMGMGASPTVACHGAARAGVINFTKSLACEWAPFKVRANSLCPGYTATDLLPPLDWQEQTTVPMGRPAQPEEMASVAAFLASEASSYVTGENIFVSGGLITTTIPMYADYLHQVRKQK